jgi:hypothetical protein
LEILLYKGVLTLPEDSSSPIPVIKKMSSEAVDEFRRQIHGETSDTVFLPNIPCGSIDAVRKIQTRSRW